VLKPAEQTPAQRAAPRELALDVASPAGVLNVAHRDGERAPLPLVEPTQHRQDRLHNGSTAVDARSAPSDAHSSASTLELGGKSAQRHHPKSRLSTSSSREDCLSGDLLQPPARLCTRARACSSPAERFDEVRGALTGSARRPVGGGLESATQLGPLVSAEQRDAYVPYIEAGARAGRWSCSREAISRLRQCGWFVELEDSVSCTT